MDFKLPLRIGAGGGLRFTGAIDDVRVYRIALTPEQSAVIPLRKSIHEIAAMAPDARSTAASDKLRFAFLETAAPKEIRQARSQMLAAQRERQRYWDSIPTVMVMAEGPPRDAFILKRGAAIITARKCPPVCRPFCRRFARGGPPTGWAWRAGWWIARTR